MKITKMTDIRFNRLAVTIFDHPILNNIFRNDVTMDRACLYFGIDEIWTNIGTRDIRSTIKFLDKLYNEQFSIFVQFLSYIIDQTPNYAHLISRYAHIWSFEINRQRVLESLSRFFAEIRTLGISWDGSKLLPTIGTSQIDHQISNKMIQELSLLGNPFVDRYSGAIDALMSDNPDGLSQSISSMRELLTAILNEKTKNETFTEQEKVNGRPTRKARMKKILSKSKGLASDAKVSEEIIGLVVSTADLLSAKYHPTTEKDREQIHFVFKSTEYLIYYILTQS